MIAAAIACQALAFACGMLDRPMLGLWLVAVGLMLAYKAKPLA